jgi:hypothetical protein
MKEELTFNLFLSHSSLDKTVVRRWAARLRQNGLKVWFGEWVLKPSDGIPARIEPWLERSCPQVLCTSAHTFGSEWARGEDCLTP